MNKIIIQVLSVFLALLLCSAACAEELDMLLVDRVEETGLVKRMK